MIARTEQDDGGPEKADTCADNVPLIRPCFFDHPKPQQRRKDIDTAVRSIGSARGCRIDARQGSMTEAAMRPRLVSSRHLPLSTWSTSRRIVFSRATAALDLKSASSLTIGTQCLQHACAPPTRNTLQLSVSANEADWLLTLTGPEGVKFVLDAEFPAH
jgi:hypothetical protein